MSEEKWIPKVRFGNFNKNWKKYLMSDVFDIKAGGDIEKEKVSKEKTIKNIYPIYANALKNEGLYGYTNTWKSEENTITVTARGALGYALPRYNKYYPIVRLLVLKPKIDSDIYFFSEAINRLTIFNEASGVPQLTAPQLRTYKLKFPLVHEQQKIGNLFKKLDQAISLQQQVLEATKDYKQSMLQKMFPKKDEKAPEIRFEGFNEEWTKTILEECVNSIPSKHYISKGETLSHGMHSVIQQGNDSILGYSNENNFYEQYQDVILFGDHTLSLYKPKNTFMVSTDGIKILQSDILDTDFLYILLQKYLPKSQGYKRHFTILKETLIRYPLSLKEQQKIGSFFKTLDEKIEQEEKKLEAYESMKKALVQRMFV